MKMEECDLYTAAREKTGLTMVRGEPFPAGCYRLVAHICIFNSAGKMLIQQRQMEKMTWPGLWSFSAAGHSLFGESTQDTAERELSEELGLHVSFSEISPAVSISSANAFEDFYLIELDADTDALSLCREEVRDVKWASEQEILHLIDAGSFVACHSSLIRLLFALKDCPGIYTEKGKIQR